jgi:hypothetical protein
MAACRDRYPDDVGPWGTDGDQWFIQEGEYTDTHFLNRRWVFLWPRPIPRP